MHHSPVETRKTTDFFGTVLVDVTEYCIAVLQRLHCIFLVFAPRVAFKSYYLLSDTEIVSKTLSSFRSNNLTLSS